MFGMVDIGVAITFILEAKDEAMSEAFVEVLFADVRAPFESPHLWNFFLQRLERFFDFLDVFRAGTRFEFERDNVVELFGGIRGHNDGRTGKGQKH